MGKGTMVNRCRLESWREEQGRAREEARPRRKCKNFGRKAGPDHTSGWAKLLTYIYMMPQKDLNTLQPGESP
eukprot:1158365-Pelagomonas_calceolata.AAC.18